MKKLLAFIALAICIFAFASCGDGKSDGEDDVKYPDATDGLEFVEISEEEYGIKCGSTTELTEIIIPKAYKGKPVTTILKSGFSKCEKLVSITIPNSITKIETGAFLKCNKLENVRYYGTLNEWAYIDFAHSTSNPMNEGKHFFLNDSETEITEVTVSDIVQVKKYAFFSFDKVTKITVTNVPTLNENSFAGCSSLAESSLKGVANFNRLCFSTCTKLTTITIPEGTIAIHLLAFYGCKSLSSVSFEVKDGWYIALRYSDPSGTALDVNDTYQNAITLTKSSNSSSENEPTYIKHK